MVPPLYLVYKKLFKHFNSCYPSLVAKYSCSICGKSIKNASNYMRHIKLHRSHSSLKADCPHCQTQFTKYNLSRHILRKHGSIVVTSVIVNELLAIACRGGQARFTTHVLLPTSREGEEPSSREYVEPPNIDGVEPPNMEGVEPLISLDDVEPPTREGVGPLIREGVGQLTSEGVGQQNRGSVGQLIRECMEPPSREGVPSYLRCAI